MRFLIRPSLWLRALLLRDRVETEMQKEMRLHLELETEENIRLGMSPGEARRRALIAFGGVEQNKEAVRDERGTRWLEQLALDLRYAFRGFRRSAGFAAAVVTIIGLGVGANVAIFSVIHHLLLAPLPFAEGNRMVQFSSTGGGRQILLSPMRRDIDRWRARARAVEQITVTASREFELGDSTVGSTARLAGAYITPGTLAFVGMRPLLGRDVAAADTLSDAAPVALIGYTLWQTKFGGSAALLGQTIIVDGVRHQVIAILPRGFSVPFSDGDQLFTALRSRPGNREVDAIAKLAPGATVEQANRELAAIFTTLDKSIAIDPPRVMRAADWVSASERRIIYLMFGAVTIVLMIACANVANLMLARAWTRQREFAVRAAMGAGRGRLVRQVFTESLALSLMGAALAAGVAWLTLKLLVVAQPSGPFEFRSARLEPAVLAWGLGISIVTGLLFGLAPALFAADGRANEALKAGTRTAVGSAGARRMRSALVITEVALSAVLLVASGLLVRSIVAMKQADVGLDPRGLWGVNVSLRNKQLGDSLARRAVVSDMLERVRAVPGVQAATIAATLPPHFVIGIGAVEIEGRPVAADDSLTSISVSIARAELFALAGIRIVEGRIFQDDATASENAHLSGGVIVNESFARRFWPNGQALGARIRRGTGSWVPIIGVAADVRTPGARDALMKTQFYQPMPGAPKRAMVVIRSAVPAATLLPSVQAAIRSASTLAVVSDVESSETILAAGRTMRRFMLLLIGTFAALALVLAAFGLHAVISYSVSQRTREIGVRVALGAQSADVMQLVVGSGLRLSAIGVVVGAVAGVATATVTRALLYGVTPLDPVTLAAVCALLGGVGVVASYVPARRAMRIDPVEALRAE